MSCELQRTERFQSEPAFHQADARSFKRERANLSYRPAVSVVDFVQFSGMQVEEPVRLAFAVGYPEKGKSDVGAVEGHKAKKREKHGVDEQRHVLPRVRAGLLHSVKHHHPENYHQQQHGQQ